MTLLGEAYVHLRPFYANDRRVEAIAVGIEQQCPIAADVIYGSSVEIGIRLEEGSLKTWVVVAGSLCAAIATYPEFKLGIKELYDDAKAFGNAILEIVEAETAVPKNRIYRVERRTKTVGRVHRLIRSIDKLKREAWKLDAAEREGRVLEIRYRLHSLLSEVDDERDKELLRAAMLSTGFTPLPEPSDRLTRELTVLKEDDVDWSAVPRLPAAVVGPPAGRPRLGWPTTILLKDGREFVLNAGKSQPLRP
jgi:hypothetical protein